MGDAVTQVPKKELFEINSGEGPIKVEVLNPETETKRCRVCWQTKEKTSGPFIQLSTYWNSYQVKVEGERLITIWKVLSFCVPKLTAKTKDFICNACFKHLEVTYSFIKRCLETESQITGLKLVTKGAVKSISQIKKFTPAFSQSLYEDVKPRIDHSYSKSAPEALPKLSSKASNKTTDNKTDSFWDNYDFNTNIIDIDDEPEQSENENFADTKENILHEDPIIIETKVEPPEPTTPESKLEDGLLELFDFSHQNSRCIVVDKEITEEQTLDLVNSGINILHMSTDPSKKKRVIYVGRDLIGCVRQCPYCNVTFFSLAEAEDHRIAHRKGKIKLDENLVQGEIFRCTECPAEFIVQRDLQRHADFLHKVKRPFPCTHCKRSFKTLKELKVHAKYTVDGLETCRLKCAKCDKEFREESLYQKHVSMSEALSTCYIRKCMRCEEWMPISALNDHVKSQHTVERGSLCPQCGKTVKYLDKHMQVAHTEDTRVCCPKCGQMFRTQGSFSMHMKLKHEEGLQLICDKCPRMFKHPLYLRKHQRVHHTDKSTWQYHQCEKCGQKFKYRSGLLLHLRTVHEGVRAYVCDLCGERFPRIDYMRRHKKYHELCMKNVCSICKTSFKTDMLLKTHMNAGHDENGQPKYRRTPFVRTSRYDDNKDPKRPKRKQNRNSRCFIPKACPICQKVLGSSFALRAHYKAHLQIMQRKCPKCDMYFANQNSLGNHLKRHDDPKYDLRCRICYISKDTKEELKEHIRTTHTNLKHKCELCTESFGRAHQLTNHIRVKHPEEHEKRNELFSLLVSQEAEDVPIETYRHARALKLTRKTTIRKDDVEHLKNALMLGKVEKEEIEEPIEQEGEYWVTEEETKQEVGETNFTEEDEDEGEEYDLFGQDYDITEEACRQLKKELEQGF